MIKASKQKLLTVDQFNKCSFYFEQARSIECVQRNSFKNSINHPVNNENGTDSIIAVLFVPTNCVLCNYLSIHEKHHMF